MPPATPCRRPRPKPSPKKLLLTARSYCFGGALGVLTGTLLHTAATSAPVHMWPVLALLGGGSICGAAAAAVRGPVDSTGDQQP